MKDERIAILGISGSLRQGSYNRALLEAATELTSAGVTMRVFEGLGAIPVFNEDLEAPAGDPAGVLALRRAVADADGVIFATPEYNQSLPGSVKNTIDWLSRSTSAGGLKGKPVAVTGATTGPWGTRIAQTALRQVLLSTGAAVLPSPMLFVASVASRFDDDRRLTDPDLRLRLAELVSATANWARLVQPGGS